MAGRKIWRDAGMAWLCLSLAGGLYAEERTRIVEEGGLREEWKLADGVQLAVPVYPPELARRGDSVCVAIGYAVDPDGSTSDFSLLKGWASSTGGDREPVPGFWSSFARAGADAVSQWRFAPRPEVRSPRRTYTVATMQFIGSEAADPAALRARCAIRDLAGLIQKHKWDGFQADSQARRELERFRREQQSRMQPMARPASTGRR